MAASRFSSLLVAVGESDLWIGYTPAEVDAKALEREAARVLRRVRNEILLYPDPDFLTSLVPLRGDAAMGASPFLLGMLRSAQLSHTGPMASVAGAVAQEVGSLLKRKFSLDEIVVENGGDLYIDVLKPLSVTLDAGNNSLSGKVSVVVEAKHCPLGICTSSSKEGHSHSFGNADAVMVACHDAALADGYATAFCNMVREASDVERVATMMHEKEQILFSLVLLDTKMALSGELEVQKHI